MLPLPEKANTSSCGPAIKFSKRRKLNSLSMLPPPIELIVHNRVVPAASLRFKVSLPTPPTIDSMPSTNSPSGLKTVLEEVPSETLMLPKVTFKSTVTALKSKRSLSPAASEIVSCPQPFSNKNASLPRPAVMVSLPSPPTNTFSPSCPTSVSLPAPPIRVTGMLALRLGSTTSTSFPAPPLK